MSLPYVSLYAAVLALIYIGLSVLTIRTRYRTRTAVGDGGHESLRRAIRAHGNFAEYVPFILLLMALLELQGAPCEVLHTAGIVLTFGRLSHVYGVTQAEVSGRPRLIFRQIGMVATFTTLGGCALLLLAAPF